MGKLGVIFDMDGVLVDSYAAHLRSWQQLAAAHGLEMTEEQFAASFGRTSREIIRDRWSGRVAERDIAAWDDEKEDYYRRILRADFPEMDGAGELIEALHEAGFALAIGSSGPPANVQAVLECLPGGRHFSAAVDGTQVTHGKPHPEVFLKAAGKLGVQPGRCAVIEDAVPGVEAARRAGMTAIAVTGTAPRERLAERARLVVDSLRELNPPLIAELIASARTGPS